MQSANSTHQPGRNSTTEAVIVSIIAAVAVFVVIIVSGWMNFRDVELVCPRQWETHNSLRQLNLMVRSLIKENGKPPATLTVSETNISPEHYANRNDRFIDAWGRELHYELKSDDSFIIYSLGRDGKPGGVGLDADLFTDLREGQLKWPTFMQFYFPGDPHEIQKGGLVVGAVFTAMLVMFAVLLSSLRASTGKSHGSLFSAESIARVIGVVLLALVFGVILALLHIPNGH
jgi:hypothetical protein